MNFSSLYGSPRILGTPAHDFDLPGTDGKNHSLASFSDAKILVVIFMCNHCPYVRAVIDRLNELAEMLKTRGVEFVGINANDAEEYPEDSFENMKKFPVKFTYLRDETQKTAKAYGAACTPDIFVYDSDRGLAYHGRIDDNWKEPEKVTKHDLSEALEKILNGESIPASEQKPSMGCSIKWKENYE